MGETWEGHETLGSEQVFDGRLVKVYVDEVKLPDGRTARWERVAHPGAVGIVPLTGDGKVLMVRQYRNAVGGDLLEIPAGKLDRGEPARECAERELTEEVGMRAGQMIKLAEFYNSPGFSDEYFHLFLARELSSFKGSTDPDEFLEVEEYTLEDLLEMVSLGTLTDAKSIIGVTMTALFLEGAVSPLETEAES